jgi:ATP-dependent Lon protease
VAATHRDDSIQREALMPPQSDANPSCHEIRPVLPLRDACLFPGASLGLVVARAATVRAVDIALRSGERILALAQRDADLPAPSARDMHGLGTLARIEAKVEQPDGNFRVELDGIQRASVVTLVGLDTMVAEVEPLEEGESGDDWGAAVEALARYIHAHGELKDFLDKQRRASEPMAWVNLARSSSSRTPPSAASRSAGASTPCCARNRRSDLVPGCRHSSMRAGCPAR